MKKRSIFCLLALFSTVVPIMHSKAETAVGRQGGQQWLFGNFGRDADGSVDIGEGKMTIWTHNTRHCFFESDQYSFAYRQQPFPYDDCSRSTMSVTVDEFKVGTAGIMMRSSDCLDAANVHLEVNAVGDVYLFYRKTDGVSTSYKLFGKVGFPAEIRLFRQGNMFTGYYKSRRDGWIKGATAMAGIGDWPLVGFYACTGNDSQMGYDVENKRRSEVTFRDWKVEYEENYIPPEENFTDDMPVKKGTLLRDNFADGCMSNGPTGIINPVWEGITHAEMPRGKDGKRYWNKRGDGLYTLGDSKWADYEVNIDMAFNKDSHEQAEFMLQVRYQNISVYDKLVRYYGVSFRDGNKLVFEKYEAGGITISQQAVIPAYADRARHRLRVKLLDKNYEVYLDDKLLISGADDLRPVTYGSIALKFTDADMAIHLVEVLEVEDPVNGSADNYLLDYYDTPLPAHLEKYGYTNDQ